MIGSTLLSGLLLRRLGIKGLIVLQPLSLVCALILVTVAPSLSMCLALGLALAVVGSAGDPAIKTLMVRVPEQIRGRVSTLVEGVTAAAGNLTAAVALLAVSTGTGPVFNVPMAPDSGRRRPRRRDARRPFRRSRRLSSSAHRRGR